MLLNFSILLARDGAWKFAGEYHLAPNKEFQIQSRDQNISKPSSATYQLWEIPFLLDKIVGFTEWKSVSKTMCQLDMVMKKS